MEKIELKTYLKLTQEAKEEMTRLSFENIEHRKFGDFVVFRPNHPKHAKSGVFHIPSGQHRKFSMPYQKALHDFAAMSAEDKERVLKEVIFEA